MTPDGELYTREAARQFCGHDRFGGPDDRVAIWASIGPAGRGLSVISMRSDINAAL